MSAGIKMLGMSQAFNALGAMADEMTDDEAWVGSTAEYAGSVEFGTQNQAAQPYLRPAINEMMKPINIEEVLGGVLEEKIKNKALQIAGEIENIAKRKAPVDTGNLRGSIQAASEETELRSKSEAAQFK